MTRASERLKQLQAKIATGNRTGARAATDDDTTSNHAELWLYGVVGGYWLWGFDAKSVGDQLRGLDVETLTVRIHSPGGSVFEGIAIANLLRNHKARVTVVVDSLAASAASIIAIAGDEVVMSPGSQFMIHDAWTCVCGNEKELQQESEWIGKQSANLAAQYVGKAGGTAEEWRARMTAEPDGTWYTADEAVAAKLADRVGTVVAASPAPPAPPEPIEDDDDDLEASAAYLLDVLQLHPAALAAWRPGGTQKPPTASADGPSHTEGGSAVALSNEQITMRQKLGIAEDADEATTLAALEEALAERADPPADPQIPEGMSLVDSTLLQQLQAGASAGQAAQQTLADQERDAVINQALKDGKIAATSRESFVESWNENPDRTRALIASLTPGLVPVTEAGHGDQPEVTEDAELYALVWGDEKKGA